MVDPGFRACISGVPHTSLGSSATLAERAAHAPRRAALAGIGDGEDLRGQEAGVGRTHIADGQRADRHPGWHLHDGVEAVLPAKTVVAIGTPSTGTGVSDAVMPGRCAAPPAPAIITFSPRDFADLAYWYRRSGVRCAETILVSKGTCNSSRISAAFLSVGQSDWLPMMIPTLGLSAIVPALVS